jgi:hypothetical protein
MKQAMKYKVIESFGGKRIPATGAEFETFGEAALVAVAHNYPTDVWTCEGGYFGQGEPIAHVGNSGRLELVSRDKALEVFAK